ADLMAACVAPDSSRLTAAQWGQISCAPSDASCRRDSRMAEAIKPDPATKSYSTGPKTANHRSTAVLADVQALYQMEVGHQSLEDTLSQFSALHLGRESEGDEYLPADADCFRQIVRGVIKAQLEIDPAIDRSLTKDWPVTRIDATLRAILR